MTHPYQETRSYERHDGPECIEYCVFFFGGERKKGNSEIGEAFLKE